jgi:hypothetical protein
MNAPQPHQASRRDLRGHAYVTGTAWAPASPPGEDERASAEPQRSSIADGLARWLGRTPWLLAGVGLALLLLWPSSRR